MKVTDQGVPVETLISVVKDSIRQAGVSRTAATRDLQVASVRLILEVVASKTAGGGLDFRVLCRAKTPAWALTWRFALARLLCGIR